MTTYPHWINEEAVNQTDIGVVCYSVVYSDASVPLLSIRDVLSVEYRHAETDSIKSRLAGTVVSESLRLCNKIISKNSLNPIVFSLFNIISEKPEIESFWSKNTNMRWSAMLLICEEKQENLNLVEFLSETNPIYTDCYQCCVYKKHLSHDFTFDTGMSYKITQRNRGLDEGSIIWTPMRRLRINIPESFLPCLHLPRPEVSQGMKTLEEEIDSWLTEDESE